ncbi:hypothetical protein GCM10011506_28560 [Marivirga lumbricoides]|uniref:Calx-beta domain-containing protein n=1 Tax=Marivirga lumbricoides TaxID=1046115 RepID=A0A2T4DV89_9BACT|nr:hypothetical protein C9994_01740 [Marivirga lumbricoides]GGC41276.1 hypothetical protein GCM10011506_28560 [Marivirga lumbricoides]
MRKILNILYVMVLIPLMTGCFDEPGTSTLITDFTDTGFVEIVEASGGASRNKAFVAVPDGENVNSSITVSYGGAVSASQVSITYEIDTEASTAIEGVDFVLLSSNTITIPAGEYTAPINFEVVDDNLEVDNPVTIVFRIVQASVPILEEYSEVSITLSVSCPAPAGIFGTYDAVTTETSPAGCNGVTNVVEITEVDGSDVELQFSDLTGGLYINCYGDADNPGIVNYVCGDLSLVNQEDVVYGDDVLNGSGTYNATTGVITLVWSNGYGDKGTTVLTKQ